MRLLLTDLRRLELLAPPKMPVRVVIDTDTFNEIDDQFALVYALLSPEQITVEAIYAAPFHNDRSSGPADGMEQSFAEIQRVLARLALPNEINVHRGATAWLPAANQAVDSAAVQDLIARARTPHADPLYVVALGAITNIASALVLAPDIAERIVVVWLAGQPSYWDYADDFNLAQDRRASQFILDSGAALLRVPCLHVAQHLRTTEAELARHIQGRGDIGDYLFTIYQEYLPDHFARSKEIWDIAPVAYLINPQWTHCVFNHSPQLNDHPAWSHSPDRHLISEMRYLDRDAIFGDFFRKLEAYAQQVASRDGQ
jgi:inosine-uridine nucleoside N-ribohydrolase